MFPFYNHEKVPRERRTRLPNELLYEMVQCVPMSWFIGSQAKHCNESIVQLGIVLGTYLEYARRKLAEVAKQKKSNVMAACQNCADQKLIIKTQGQLIDGLKEEVSNLKKLFDGQKKINEGLVKEIDGQKKINEGLVKEIQELRQQFAVFAGGNYAQQPAGNSQVATDIGVQHELPHSTSQQHHLGPIGKTLYSLRQTLGFGRSASLLCSSREEWQESFDSLLGHKDGCDLFREFLKVEFSDENLEFWLECEEFKRLGADKKETAQKAQQIFDNFLKEKAPREVNLDSQTRLTTTMALEGMPIRMDTFDLARTKLNN